MVTSTPRMREVGVEMLLHQPHRLEQRRQPLQRVVLGLHRDEHLARRHQRVDGEHAERRRAVDEDEVVGVERPASGVVEDVLVAVGVGQLDDGAGEIGRCRHEREVLDGRRHRGLAHAAAPPSTP